jgi:hypothetical protein
VIFTGASSVRVKRYRYRAWVPQLISVESA